jgi:hypothetical protein
MRRILTLSLMTLGLTGGVALADNGRRVESRREPVTVRDHRAPQRVEREPVRVERREQYRNDRNDRARPEVRFERHEDRRGFQWVGGEWTWNSYEWIWVPGHYVRIGRW